MVQIFDNSRGIHTCRALLVTRSRPNLIAEELVERLNLRKTSVELVLSGIRNKPSSIGHRTGVVVSQIVSFREEPFLFCCP